MDVTGSAEIVIFGEFRLVARGGGLFRCVDGKRLVPISIGSRALGVLGALVERPGEVVSKDEIMQAVWPGTAVEEANLFVQLSKLRRILDADLHDADSPGGSHIQTVPGRGYRFTRPVTRRSTPIRPARLLPTEKHALATAPASGLRRFSPAAFVISAAAILLAVFAIGRTWPLHHPSAPRPVAYSAQDRRRSVMVLPFTNSSGDPAQDHLAAEVTRDVTDIIATDDSVPIVVRTGAAADSEAPGNLRSIGRDYDVHFVLSGHAWQNGGHVLVAVTLYQTDDERAAWTQRYDCPDQPEALRSIVQNIGDGFDLATENAERMRAKREHPDDMDKRDLLFAANATSLLQPSAENYATRIALVDRALALDPNYVWALRKTGMLHAQVVLRGFSSDRDADLAVALKATDRALMLAPNDTSVLRAKATVLRAGNDWRGAEALFRMVIELQPMVADAHVELAQMLMDEGRYEDALETLSMAQRLLVPNDHGKYFHVGMAAALVANARYTEAIGPARLAISEFPPESGAAAEPAWLALIAAEVESGQDAEARADLRKFLDTPHHFHSIGEVQKTYHLAANQNLLEGLRRAGMPAD